MLTRQESAGHPPALEAAAPKMGKWAVNASCDHSVSVAASSATVIQPSLYLSKLCPRPVLIYDQTAFVCTAGCRITVPSDLQEVGDAPPLLMPAPSFYKPPITGKHRPCSLTPPLVSPACCGLYSSPCSRSSQSSRAMGHWVLPCTSGNIYAPNGAQPDQTAGYQPADELTENCTNRAYLATCIWQSPVEQLLGEGAWVLH